MRRPTGRIPTGQRKYEIQHMWQRHHEIVRLSCLGFSNKDIALKLGITPQTVSNTLNSRIAKDKVNQMRAEVDRSTTDVVAVIKELPPQAIEEVGRFLDPERNGGIKDELRLKAAHDILDRAGHAAPKEIHAKHMHAYLSADDIDEIKQRSRAAARESGILDVEAI